MRITPGTNPDRDFNDRDFNDRDFNDRDFSDRDFSDRDFSDWYAREFPRVRSTVAFAVGDAGLGEEATAEAFAKALLRWPTVSKATDPTAWVRTVALNEVRSRLRRLRLERRYRARLTEQYTPPPPEPHPALWAAVAHLAPRAREAVALRYVADLSEPEVAAAMGISRGAVASTLSRARQQLAGLLADHYDSTRRAVQ
jgi:RNA polymerase sigma-70 factor, ECF subfamily